jgi:hypothetical protein
VRQVVGNVSVVRSDSRVERVAVSGSPVRHNRSRAFAFPADRRLVRFQMSPTLFVPSPARNTLASMLRSAELDRLW